MKRRNVLSVLAGIGIAATGKAQGNGMIYRSFGKTHEKVSAIGLGGHHIGRPQDPNEGIRIIRSAIDRGITFMDNCWDYHNGESERRMGLALGDGYRQKVFLMTRDSMAGRRTPRAGRLMNRCEDCRQITST